MATSESPDVAQKLAQLQATFKQQLPEKIQAISDCWAQVCQSGIADKSFNDFYILCHSLAGSGGTFGAAAISHYAREIEDTIKPLFNDDTHPFSTLLQDQVSKLIAELGQAVDKWQPGSIPLIQPANEDRLKTGTMIYLVDDDKIFAENLVTLLEKEDYQVRYFSSIDDFEKAFNHEMPAVIIMDVIFNNSVNNGADIISILKQEREVIPPVVFISEHDDIETRLATVHAGVSRYFSKPLKLEKLIRTLSILTLKKSTESYRVLLIDDDKDLLEYYSTILLSAGMKVKTLSQPMLALDVINQFNPDIIVLDVYMPECTGPELAQVIRQDDTWALTPIMFLSSESDITQKLSAMSLGGDDFLVKPVEARHFISAVTARARRARAANSLQNDLQNALRESEYQLTTMNQHNIVSCADVSGDIISVNDNFCKVSGYSREELLGHNHRLINSGFHPSVFFKDMWKTITQGKVWRGTICNRRKNGEEYWVESTIVPFLDVTGKPYKYVSARTDVTLLRKSEERLQRSQEFANIGTWDWNIKTGELFWSDRIAPLFGYRKTVPETTYENFLSAVHKEDQQMVNDAVNNCVEHNAVYNIEHRVVWDDGSVHWVLEQGNVIRNTDGEALHMLGVVQDIDIRKRSELLLADREKQLIEAQQLAQIGNWQADISKGTLTWSDEIYRIFGYEPGSFLPNIEAFHTAIHPDDLNLVRESELQAEKTGIHDVVHRIIRPDKTIRYVHELAQAETDSNGKLISLRGTVQDITKRMEAEAKLRETEERFTFAVEGAGDGVWDWDMKTNDMQFSRIYMQMLGYEENELPHTVDTWKNSVHPDDLDRVTDNLTCYLNGELDIYHVELRLQCKSGEYKWILCRGTVVARDTLGNAIRMIGIHSDITEQKEIEQNLIDVREEAINANRAKSSFLSMMSHELRTPMNAIIGFSQLLTMPGSDPLSDVQKENVHEIIKAGNHLLELINEILDLAKVESGRIDFSIEAVMLGEVLADSLQLITPLMNERNIELVLRRNNIEFAVDDLLKTPIIVRADRIRLRQVILNLLSNAVKYNNENGKITISCDRTNKGIIRISVTDTGIGISTENQGKLFDAFNRLGAEQTNIEGTGIGLVITKSIVEQMGGEIGFKSEKGVGSTFWIELNEDSQPGNEDKVRNENQEQNEPDTTEYEHTVLYIEDNPANLRLVSQLLAKQKFIHMWTAHEPMLGLELATAKRPDLILLDINLPGMDGYGVLSELKKRDETRDITVIAISANAMPTDIEKGLKAGFDHYITKPIDLDALLKAIKSVFADNKLNK